MTPVMTRCNYGSESGVRRSICGRPAVVAGSTVDPTLRDGGAPWGYCAGHDAKRKPARTTLPAWLDAYYVKAMHRSEVA